MSTQLSINDHGVPSRSHSPFRDTARENTGEHAYLGLDKTGAIHHYCEHESRIVVIKSAEIVHVERFDDYDDRDLFVTDWIEFIEHGPEDDPDEDGRGWEEQPFMTQHQFFDARKKNGFEVLFEKMEGRQ